MEYNNIWLPESFPPEIITSQNKKAELPKLTPLKNQILIGVGDLLYQLCEKYTRKGEVYLSGARSNSEEILSPEELREMNLKLMGSINPELDHMITIDTSFPRDAQLVTLMHEVLHMHPSFNYWYFEKLKADRVTVEKAITKYAKHLLRKRPDIKNLLETRLDEAYEYDKELPF